MRYKGFFRPRKISKYKGDHRKIVYRSKLELTFMKYCDDNPDIIEWGSEEIIIPYVSPIDGRRHRYFPDFFVKTSKGDKFLIEVKPKSQTKPPKVPRRKTKRFIYETHEWGKNQAKWEAANAVCQRNGWKFIILTEDHLKTPKYLNYGR